MMDYFQTLLIPKEGLLLPLITAGKGAFAASLLKDRFPFLLAELFGGWLPGNANFRGTWKTVYDYGKDVRKSDDPKLFIKQFGVWLKGRGHSTIDKSKLVVRAKITETGVITGDWQEWTATGKHYYGAFQLNVTPEFSEMEGQWIGVGKNRRVNNGPWRWTKLPA